MNLQLRPRMQLVQEFTREVQFLENVCVCDPKGRTPHATLYENYRQRTPGGVPSNILARVVMRELPKWPGVRPGFSRGRIWWGLRIKGTARS